MRNLSDAVKLWIQELSGKWVSDGGTSDPNEVSIKSSFNWFVWAILTICFTVLIFFIDWFIRWILK